MSADRLQLEDHVARLCEALAQQARPLFSGQEAPVVARAPGRLDVMGGIGDYSGCQVLELPLEVAAFACVQRTRTPHVRIVSAGFGHDVAPLRDISLPLAELRGACRSYREARAYFQASAGRAWAAYVAGALVALQVELGVELSGGLDILVCSSVPEGKGVSSSAAVEVASFRALCALVGVDVDPVRGALLCQRIENLVVGAPCGVMDQMTSSCGNEGRLLALTCQPARLDGSFPVASGLSFWGIDSLLRHQVSGASYTEVRVAAFMGYTILAQALGLPIRRAQPGKVVVDDGRFGGYLANVGVEVFERELAPRLPERLSGEGFLRDHAGITDTVTDVSPGSTYRVRAATAHPVYEHARVREFRSLMERGASPATCARLGQLMYEAHDSYGACGLGSPGTDRLVSLVRDMGPGRGLYGAKITGGGSGGTVAVLGASGAEHALREVVARYASEMNGEPHVFRGSSPGAAEFGIARLVLGGGNARLEHGERRACVPCESPKGFA